MATSPLGRCATCGARLARENPGPRCSPCVASRRHAREPAALDVPDVPAEFWEHPPIRAALQSRHMGKVLREYRRHPFHGPRQIPQYVAGLWFGLAQTQVSRVESGQPIVHLDRLIQWARTLKIPARYLWFALPDQSETPAVSRHSAGMLTNCHDLRSFAEKSLDAQERDRGLS